MDHVKYKYPSLEKLMEDVWIRYHNEIGRFYAMFFTHDLPMDHEFRMYEEDIPMPAHLRM